MSSEAAVRDALLARGLSWPAPIEWHASVGSTNDLLRERARAGGPAWTVVGADRQTAGRGRQGRTWVSAPGNLYLSVLLRPGREALAGIGLLPLLAGLAVAEAASEWGVAARLKWPNDVVGGRETKLAGILAESASNGAGVDHVVLGIGVNLAAAPAELRATATSVEDEGGRAPAVPDAAAGLLAALYRDCERSLASPSGIVARWRALSVDWWGRDVEVLSGETRVTGRALDVDDSGALLVATGSGTMRVLSGDARALRLGPGVAREGRA